MTNFTPEIQKYDKNTSHIRQQKQYLDLLLLADEQESMIDRYLNGERCSSYPIMIQSKRLV